MKEKLQELAQKYDIPLGLLMEAIDLEKEKIILQNRRATPKLIEMIEKYADTTPE